MKRQIEQNSTLKNNFRFNKISNNFLFDHN